MDEPEAGRLAAHHGPSPSASCTHAQAALPSDLAVCCDSAGRCLAGAQRTAAAHARLTLSLRGPQVPGRQLVTSADAVAISKQVSAGMTRWQSR
jgi:hypothetical protein